MLSIDFVPHHGWLAVAPRDEEILAHVVIVGFVQLEACLVVTWRHWARLERKHIVVITGVRMC